MSWLTKPLLGFVLLAVAAGVGLWWALNDAEEQKEIARAETRISDFASSKLVTGITIERDDDVIALEKRDGSWWITQPVSDLAETTAVDAMISRMVGLRFERELQPSEDEPIAYDALGLKPPRFKVTLRGADQRETWWVGKRGSFDGSLYLQRAAQPEVFIVDGSTEYILDRDLFTLRDKRMLRVTTDEVTTLTVEPRRNQAFTLVRKDDSWWMKSPQEFRATHELVEQTVSSLVGLRAQNFVAPKTDRKRQKEMGLPATPLYTVTLTTSSDARHTLQLFELKGEEPQPAYFAISSQVAQLARVSGAALVARLRIKPERFRDDRLLRFEREKVRSIVLKQDDSEITITNRAPEGGKPQWHHKDEPLQNARVEGLLYKLLQLQVPQRTGRNKPLKSEKEIALCDASGTPMATLRVGPSEQDQVPVCHHDNSRCGSVPKADLEGVIFDLSHYRREK